MNLTAILIAALALAGNTPQLDLNVAPTCQDLKNRIESPIVVTGGQSRTCGLLDESNCVEKKKKLSFFEERIVNNLNKEAQVRINLELKYKEMNCDETTSTEVSLLGVNAIDDIL